MNSCHAAGSVRPMSRAVKTTSTVAGSRSAKIRRMCGGSAAQSHSIEMDGVAVPPADLLDQPGPGSCGVPPGAHLAHVAHRLHLVVPRLPGKKQAGLVHQPLLVLGRTPWTSEVPLLGSPT